MLFGFFSDSLIDQEYTVLSTCICVVFVISFALDFQFCSSHSLIRYKNYCFKYYFRQRCLNMCPKVWLFKRKNLHIYRIEYSVDVKFIYSVNEFNSEVSLIFLLGRLVDRSVDESGELKLFIINIFGLSVPLCSVMFMKLGISMFDAYIFMIILSS